MVKIVAALAWFAEPPAFLDRLVRSLEGVADVLLALDGRWDLFPANANESTHDEYAAISGAALDVGLDLRVGSSEGGPWDSQVAKRDELMLLAGELGDWIFVLDGDEFITLAEMDVVRAQLEETPLHVAQAMTVPQNRSWPHDGLPKNPRPVRKLFRAGTRLPGPAHNGYRFFDEWLMGDLAHVSPAPALDLSAHLHVAHDNSNRGRERNNASKHYRRARREGRVEAWA